MKRSRKSRQKRTHRKRTKVRKANTTARAKARSRRTDQQVQEDRERDRMRKQIARDRKRKEQVLVETVDEEDYLEEYDDDLSLSIETAIKDARAHLHRTKVNNDPTIHRAHVCIVCDCFIKSCEPVQKMTMSHLKKHKHKLGIAEYEKYHKVKLKDELKKQYHVSGFPGMLLSPRSKKIGNGWLTCMSCRASLRPKHEDSVKPPKYAIANGFAIGEFPHQIRRQKPTLTATTRSVDIGELTDEIKAILAAVRPYGYVFAYSGGAQKSISGHHAFFETDQSRVGGAMNHMHDELGVSENMYIMLCGRMTPAQREVVRRRVIIDSEEYFDILHWFITESGHPGYANLPVPKQFPSPCFVSDEPTENNTDESRHEEVENRFQGGTYYYSTAQEPSDKTGIYDDSKAFAMAMMNQSSPTLLTIGGNYAKSKELRLEDVLPFAFPYGMGGPKGARRTRISEEQCLQRYFRLSMRQFMTGDVCLVIHQMYGRILSFRSGVMVCRSQVNGVSLGETLSKFTTDDIPKDGSTNTATDAFLKAINTSCKALGHTTEAAKAARKGYFSYMDHFGLNSLFLTVTPDDQRNFRIRLYLDSGRNVSKKSENILNFSKTKVSFS